ncbi:hypothetical protein SAMN02745181_2408 [Rubritalea squalenifaciens DSM 18772]|uniref:Uncharacterized protein n=1 Tax=Rubritalea squalenifaciens DSM 18772 TaxID=1123071 RepID=A0A1M6LIT6_9BACT|nr:hypothetical protein SAMN02745181_2408 [Rubritalea squalenifaciens DSM 18772]
MDEAEASRLVQKPLHQRDFDRVALWLKGLESEQRVRFITSHLDFLPTYRLAISVVNDRRENFAILNAAIDAIDEVFSQRVRAVVKLGVKKVGARRTVKVIESCIESRPEMVDMAIYWLHAFVPQADTARSDLNALKEKAKKLGIIRPPVTTICPDGRVLFHDRFARKQSDTYCALPNQHRSYHLAWRCPYGNCSYCCCVSVLLAR